MHSSPRPLPPRYAYSAAAAAVVAAAVLRSALAPWLDPHAPYVTFFVAVVLAGWTGGTGPGLLATGLSVLAAVYVVLPPTGAFAVQLATDRVGVGVFALMGAAISALAGRKHASERRARQRTEALRTTLASIGDAVVTTDTRGYVTFLNGVAERLTGWRTSEALGRPLEQVFHIVEEGTGRPADSPVRRALTEGIVVGLANHTLLLRRDGTSVPIDDSAAPIRDGDDPATGAVLVFRDVSEARAAEAELRAQEEQFRRAIEEAPIPVVVHTEDGEVLQVSRSWVELTGYGLDDTPALRSLLARAYGAEGDSLPTAVTAVFASGASMRAVEFDLITARGETRIWSYSASSPGTLRDGRRFVVGMAEDVTTRRQAERAQARLAAIVVASDDAIVSKSLDGTIQTWNRGAERIFGWTAAQAVGRSITLIIPPELHDEERQILTRLQRGEHIDHYETVRVTRDGQRVDVSLTISPILDAAGNVVAASKVGRDITEQKRARDALRHRERLFSALVSASSQTIWYHGPAAAQHPLGDAGSAAWWREFTGQDDAALQGEDGFGWLDVVHADDRDTARRGWQTVLTGRERFEVEFRVRRHDGVWRWLAMRGVPLSDGADGPPEWTGTLVDVTHRREAEASLRQSEARYRHLVDLLPIAVYTCRHDGRITFFNQHAVAIWGRQPVANESHYAFAGSIRMWNVDGEPIPAGHSPTTRVLREGRAFRNHEVVIEQPDGRRIQLLLNAEPIRDDDGTVLGAIVAFTDTTRLRRAERALRDSEEAYRSLVEIITDVPWRTDPEGAFVRRQPTWERYTGQTWEQHRGFGWVDAIHPDDREALLADWRQAVATSTTYDARGRLWHAATGTHRHFVARAAPLLDADGHVREWVGTCTDVHEQTVAREELVVADRRKDEFLATLAHELRNPLAPIRNSIETLKLTVATPDVRTAATETIDRQVRVMERLMDDLLDVSRVTRNRLEMRKTRIELGSVLHQAVESCRPLSDRAGHEVRLTLPSETVWLDADPVRLVQMFSNLLNNACKYTDPGGHIAIEGAVEGDEVAVAVVDDGIGMPAELLPEVFEMFRQIDPNDSRAREGLGIGLTLVQQIAALHGGSVTAHSDGPGRGSRFVVRLPTQPPPDLTPEPPQQRAGTGETRRRRVLIVDDNVDAAKSMVLLLDLRGFVTAVAHDGEAALATAAAFAPDVVLLDIGLPRRNGYDVCRTLRREPGGSELTIVALTGWGQSEDRRKSREAGFDAHLVKPIDAATLFDLLDHGRPDRATGSDA